MDTIEIRPVVGVLLERAISYADDVFPWLVATAQAGWPMLGIAHMRADKTRNIMVQELLQHPQFTHLVMLDIDHAHPLDIVERLCARVHEDPSRQVVAALCFRRGTPYDPLVYVYDDDEPGLFVTAKEWESGEVIRVDRLGTGAIIIAREVFETLPGPPWFYYDYSGVLEGNWPGHDVTFCRLCEQHGITLWSDTGTISDHLTVMPVNAATFRRYVSYQAYLPESERHPDLREG